MIATIFIMIILYLILILPVINEIIYFKERDWYIDCIDIFLFCGLTFTIGLLITILTLFVFGGIIIS